jgi:hypothetical protein
MAFLTDKEISALSMSDKIKLAQRCMESLCGDFQKSERHNDILENDYPFGTSMDELSHHMLAWSKSVEFGEMRLPVITKERSVQVFVSEGFCKYMQDSNARIYVKEIEHGRKEVFFKYSTDENTTWYQGVEDGADLEDIITMFMQEHYDNDHWNYDELEFINWLSN